VSRKQPQATPPALQSPPVGQGLAHVPLLSSTVPDGQAEHAPLTQLPLEQTLPQKPQLFGSVCRLVHLSLQQVPLQHCAFFLHFFPSGLQSSSAAATPPRDPSVPPRRAAPINLSALRRETLPLESPIASSSKELLAPVLSLAIGYPFPQRSGTPQSPTTLYNPTLATLGTGVREMLVTFVPIVAGELPRTPLPRRWVNNSLGIHWGFITHY